MRDIDDECFDEERALYGLTDARVTRCCFGGPADGESALKECRMVDVADCRFSLRYPLWHNEDFSVVRCYFDQESRAPLWYDHHGKITDSEFYGVKCLRECTDMELRDVTAQSTEFAWHCRRLSLDDCRISGEYAFFGSSDLYIKNLHLSGKYSFQYIADAEISGAVLDTKDCFWHCRNVTVRDSILTGEYLGWYAEGLTLINCRISGTQPLCYARGLKLIHCTMADADLSFENSEVDADIYGYLHSVKNPRAGHIVADRIGFVEISSAPFPVEGQVTDRSKQP